MANLADILVILDRESVLASNAPDMRRVLGQMASELRGASQRRAKRGEAISTLRSWGVEVAS